MADIEKYVADVKRYVPGCDEVAVSGLVKHYGIALRNKDSSLVSATDPEEVNRVVQGFCKKKLARTESDADLLKAVTSVLEKMKADRQKSRVTVSYLLADHYKQLSLFHPKAK